MNVIRSEIYLKSCYVNNFMNKMVEVKNRRRMIYINSVNTQIRNRLDFGPLLSNSQIFKCDSPKKK